MTEIIFWQNTLSIHQAPFIRALSAREDVDVHVVAFSEVSIRRRSMGWHTPDFGEAQVRVVDGADELAEVYQLARTIPFHIFSGFGAYPGVRAAFKEMAAEPALRRFIVTEPWDVRGLRGLIRSVLSAVRVSQCAPALSGVLACGSRARTQLRRIPAMRSVPIYDFGYFVDETAFPSESEDEHTEEPWRVIFVGDLAEWKNPLGLLSALSNVQDEDWTLTMVGEGPQADAVLDAIARHRLSDRVDVHPRASNADVRARIARSDLLVLPSTYDGWGAVVSEAMMDGTRVIVSDAAGASDLVVDSGLGTRFNPHIREDLERAFRRSFRMARSGRSRLTRVAWAAATISPAAASAYLAQILDTYPGAVSAPWVALKGGT